VHAVASTLGPGPEVAAITTLANVEGLAPATAGVASTTTTRSSTTTIALHSSGHGDTLAAVAHAVALGLARGEGEAATPEAMTTTVAAVGVSAGTLVHAVALVLHEGVEVALVTLLASVERLAPGFASALLALAVLTSMCGSCTTSGMHAASGSIHVATSVVHGTVVVAEATVRHTLAVAHTVGTALVAALVAADGATEHDIVGEAAVVAVLGEASTAKVPVLVEVGNTTLAHTDRADVVVLHALTHQCVHVVAARGEADRATTVVAVLVEGHTAGWLASLD